MAKILVIDDDATVRVLLQAALTEAGHDPAFAPNGEAVLKFTRDQSLTW